MVRRVEADASAGQIGELEFAYAATADVPGGKRATLLAFAQHQGDVQTAGRLNDTVNL